MKDSYTREEVESLIELTRNLTYLENALELKTGQYRTQERLAERTEISEDIHDLWAEQAALDRESIESYRRTLERAESFAELKPIEHMIADLDTKVNELDEYIGKYLEEAVSEEPVVVS